MKSRDDLIDGGRRGSGLGQRVHRLPDVHADTTGQQFSQKLFQVFTRQRHCFRPQPVIHSMAWNQIHI